MRVEQLPVTAIPLERRDVAQADPTGLVARLENRLHKLQESGASYRAEALVSGNKVAEIAARTGRPFEYQPRLGELRSRLRDIEAVLAPSEPGPTGADSTPSPAPAPPVTPPALALAKPSITPSEAAPSPATQPSGGRHTPPQLPEAAANSELTTAEYGECPSCLNNDVKSLTGGLMHLQCGECGWVGYNSIPRAASEAETAPAGIGPAPGKCGARPVAADRHDLAGAASSQP